MRYSRTYVEDMTHQSKGALKQNDPDVVESVGPLCQANNCAEEARAVSCRD